MFSKETEYAIRGLVYIQQQNSRGLMPGTDEVAREIDAPRFYTAKILQRLVRMGFLRSQKGKGGGFYFDENKPELYLKDIILSTEGDSTISGCGFGLHHCSNENPCPLHFKFAPIRDALSKFVSQETIQSLAGR